MNTSDTGAVPLPAAELFFPLKDGHIYQYSSLGRDGRNGFMVLTIGRDGDQATLSTGKSIQKLSIRPDGIYNNSGYYILKLPMELGTQWRGQSGVVEVVQANQSVQTEAGTFSECVVTREVTQGTVEVRTAENTYCPNVGLVRLHVNSESAGTPVSETVTLKYFGEPVDVSSL